MKITELTKKFFEQEWLAFIPTFRTSGIGVPINLDIPGNLFYREEEYDVSKIDYKEGGALRYGLKIGQEEQGELTEYILTLKPQSGLEKVALSNTTSEQTTTIDNLLGKTLFQPNLSPLKVEIAYDPENAEQLKETKAYVLGFILNSTYMNNELHAIANPIPDDNEDAILMPRNLKGYQPKITYDKLSPEK